MEKTGHFFPTSSIGSEKRAKTGVTGITSEAEQIAEQKIGVCRSPFFCRIPNSFQQNIAKFFVELYLFIEHVLVYCLKQA